MRWLVTGGAGFIGINLVRSILNRSDEDTVRILDNFSVGTIQDVTILDLPANRVELVEADVESETATLAAAADIDVVVHLAANTGVAPSVANPRADCMANVIGTFNIIEACRQQSLKRFILASSGAVVGEGSPPLHEELPVHPVSPYGASKLAGEAYCSAYAHAFGIEALALRFGNCYGPFSTHKGSLVAKLISAAIAGEPWEIYGDGLQTRDFIYVDDVVEAILRSAIAPNVGGEIFQIATARETTVLELVHQLAAALRRHGITPPPVKHTVARTGDVRRNYSDTNKARMRLDWSPRISLDEGLERTVAWFVGRAATGSQSSDRTR